MTPSPRALAQTVAACRERWERLGGARRLRPADLVLARRTDQARSEYLAARAALLQAVRPTS